MNTTLEREPRLATDVTLAAGVTPLASPAFSAPAHSAAQVSDSDDPATVLDESLSARAERPHPIPHVAPHG